MSETALTAADIVAALHSGSFTVADRVAIVRALRVTTPGLVAPDPRLSGRIRSARAVRRENIDSTIHALEDSEIWQQTAATTPQELRVHRAFEGEHQALIEELQAFYKVLKNSVNYYHMLCVDKCRAVFRAGQVISGPAAVVIKAHLGVIAETRPPVGRKRKKPAQA